MQQGLAPERDVEAEQGGFYVDLLPCRAWPAGIAFGRRVARASVGRCGADTDVVVRGVPKLSR